MCASFVQIGGVVRRPEPAAHALAPAALAGPGASVENPLPAARGRDSRLQRRAVPDGTSPDRG